VYQIVEQEIVTQTIAEAYIAYSRFHDVYDMMTWLLARDPYPEEARQLSPGTYLVKSAAWDYDGFCVVTLIYTVVETPQMIFLEDIRVTSV